MNEAGKLNQYDERQLRLMLKSLISIEKQQIELNALVGTLEFLLSVMELVEDDWEEKFLSEVTTLGSINALVIIRASGEEIPNISIDQSDQLINSALSNLKALIERKIWISR